jgi:hypothetical protein
MWESGEHIIPSATEISPQSSALRSSRLFFASQDMVDTLFANLARSLVSGKLSEHTLQSVDEEGRRNLLAGTIKVSTADHASPETVRRGREETEGAKRWIICVYFQSCWDKAHAKQVCLSKVCSKAKYMRTDYCRAHSFRLSLLFLKTAVSSVCLWCV